MILRSFLFVPADSEKKLAKVDGCGADAVILDLEDAVTPSRKALARDLLCRFLRQRPPGQRSCQLWVRINPLQSRLALDDLAAVIPASPEGIMLPKCAGPEAVQQLGHYLDALETVASLPAGRTQILPLITETAAAALSIGRYAGATLPRLYGLTWGAEDLSADLGAGDNRDASGNFSDCYRMVRAQTLLAARALGVEPVETLHADFRDVEGLRSSSRTAAGEGFSGRLAIHPAQVAPINDSFLPSAREIALAEKVVAAFEANPDAGTVGIDGSMYDLPHLRRARRILDLAAAHAPADR
jgi:citrate lyase subunit beta/citryl-CoA lyase